MKIFSRKELKNISLFFSLPDFQGRGSKEKKMKNRRGLYKGRTDNFSEGPI